MSENNKEFWNKARRFFNLPVNPDKPPADFTAARKRMADVTAEVVPKADAAARKTPEAKGPAKIIDIKTRQEIKPDDDPSGAA